MVKERQGEKKPLKIIAKILRRDADWVQSEMEEALHWLRQLQAIILGIPLGVIPIEGFIGNIAFLLFNTILPIIFVGTVLGLDEDNFGGRWELIKEGFFAAYCSFLFWWIMTYTLLHA